MPRSVVDCGGRSLVMVEPPWHTSVFSHSLQLMQLVVRDGIKHCTGNINNIYALALAHLHLQTPTSERQIECAQPAVLVFSDFWLFTAGC